MEGIVLELLLTGRALFKGSSGPDLQQNFDDSFVSLAIPESRNAGRLGVAGEDLRGGGSDFCGIGADELVSALRNRDRAFGIFAKLKARDAESSGFFLHATRIGEDERGFAEKGKGNRGSRREESAEAGDESLCRSLRSAAGCAGGREK